MKRMRSILLLLVLLASALAQAPTPQPAALPVGNARIAAVKGAVTFKTSAGADIPSSPGQSLAPGTVIETAKGSAVLNLQDGSQVQVKPNSRVVIQSPLEERRYSLEMFIGKLIAKIQKKTGAAPSFRMGTPTAVITVRGTEFSVEVTKKGRTEVQVYDGLVEVRGLTSSQPGVLIRPGFFTDIEPNKPPEAPREFGPPNPQQRGEDSIRSRDYGDDRTGRGERSEPSERQGSGSESSSERDR